MYTDHYGNSNLRIVDSNGKEIHYSSMSMQTYNPSIDNQYVPQMPGNTCSSSTATASSNYTDAYTKSLTCNDYSSSLPKGIPKYMIPPGNEDLYILKSEVVPPVCPACPPQMIKSNDEPPPPCPPCARCPEPKFDCKKVPKYGNDTQGANYYGGGEQTGMMSSSSNPLPYPSLPTYSTFGN
jgi:hypothetical protein